MNFPKLEEQILTIFKPIQTSIGLYITHTSGVKLRFSDPKELYNLIKLKVFETPLLDLTETNL